MSDSQDGHGVDLRLPCFVAMLANAALLGMVVTRPAPGVAVFSPFAAPAIRIVLPAAIPARADTAVSDAGSLPLAEPGKTTAPAGEPTELARLAVTPSPPAPVSRAPARRIGDVEVLGLAYALPMQEDLGKDGLRVKKRLIVGGFGSRMVDIYLHPGSRIEIEGAELIGALVSLGAVSKEQAEAMPLGRGRQTFTAVREAGLDLDYDAVRDTLVIDAGSAGIAPPVPG